MEQDVFRKLNSEEWSERAVAARKIDRCIADESALESILEIRENFDDQYVENKGLRERIKNPEILYLREAFADRCRHLKLHDPRVLEILKKYVSDILPDTYPHPFFGQQGPEWTAPSKWKVRSKAALALGTLGDVEFLPVLQAAFEKETVEPVRRCIALSISALQHGRQKHLSEYLAAYETRDRVKAAAAVRYMLDGVDLQVNKELSALLQEIES